MTYFLDINTVVGRIGRQVLKDLTRGSTYAVKENRTEQR